MKSIALLLLAVALTGCVSPIRHDCDTRLLKGLDEPYAKEILISNCPPLQLDDPRIRELEQRIQKLEAKDRN